MSLASAWTAVWATCGVLALEVAVVAALVALVQRVTASAPWRRMIGQAGFVALAAVLLLELTGEPRAWVRARSEDRPAPSAGNTVTMMPRPTTPGEPQAAFPLAESAAAPFESRGRTVTPVAPLPAPVALTGSTATQSSLLSGLVCVWFGGAVILLALQTFARLSVAVLRRRSRAVTNVELLGRLAALARRLGLGRTIRLMESARIPGPVAAGLLYPAVVLPLRFAEEHSPDEQEVILAHEVAHLAAWDPAWYLLADLVAALLWWHPGVWWARRRLHAASEAAADEASLLVRDGPRVLAGCLVALGARLTGPRPAVWLGVEGTGFRSGLGRRVEQLLRLPGRTWAPPRRGRAALLRTLAPAALVTALIFCTAWTIPTPTNQGENMNKTTWKKSFAVSALLSALAVGGQPVPTAVPSLPPPPPRLEPSVPLTKGAASLKAKLESIVLDEIKFDSLPLAQVIDTLGQESARRDPEKLGVNFLFGKPTEPLVITTPVDPATGLPVATSSAEMFDLGATVIRIIPALKKIRLLDALDAITKVADQPIKYSIEGYAVVITFDTARINAARLGNAPPPPPAPVTVSLHTRSFKLDTNAFFQSVKAMFRHNLDPTKPQAGEELRRSILPSLGVKLDAPDSLFLYNPVTGVVLARSTQEDLAALEGAFEMLGGTASDRISESPGGGGGGRNGGDPASPKPSPPTVRR